MWHCGEKLRLKIRLNFEGLLCYLVTNHITSGKLFNNSSAQRENEDKNNAKRIKLFWELRVRMHVVCLACVLIYIKSTMCVNIIMKVKILWQEPDPEMQRRVLRWVPAACWKEATMIICTSRPRKVRGPSSSSQPMSRDGKGTRILVAFRKWIEIEEQ